MINIVTKHTNHSKAEFIQKGIYKLFSTNRLEKIYIGSTFDKKGFFHRWYAHINLLRQGKHFCKHLQAISNKYGIDSLKFEIIEVLDNKEACYLKEKEYIDLYDKTHILLNTVKEAFAPKNRPVSKKTRAKLSAALKGKCYHNNHIPIFEYSLNMIFKQKWDSLADFARSRDIGRTGLNFNKSVKIYEKFVLSKTQLTEEEIINIKNGAHKRYNTQKIPISQHSLDGTFIKNWESARKAELFYNLNKGNICQALKGKQKTAKGFIWKYLNN